MTSRLSTILLLELAALVLRVLLSSFYLEKTTAKPLDTYAGTGASSFRAPVLY